MEFLFAVIHPETVSGVDDPDDSVCLFKVVPPVGTQGALSADIPCALLNNAPDYVPMTTHIYSEYSWGCH